MFKKRKQDKKVRFIAKEILRANGWTKDSFYSAEGKYCIVGALSHAAMEVSGSSMPLTKAGPLLGMTSRVPEAHALYSYTLQRLEKKVPGGSVIRWQDKKSTSFSDVQRLLDGKRVK